MFDLILSQPLSLAGTVIGAILMHNACKGVAKLGNLVLGKQFRQKEYKDILSKAQAAKDVKAIEAGDARFDGETLQTVLPVPDLPLNVPPEYLPMSEGQRQESSNLNANLGIALCILADTEDDKISDEPVSPDWFARWRREAQTIGDQELQQLWGRILAEEVKNPKSVSLKALDVLKNVTSADVELFRRVAQYHINMIIFDKWRVTPWPYTLEETVHLENLGFLGGNTGLYPSAIDVIESDKKGFICHGFALIFDAPRGKIYFKEEMSGPALSITGKEILRVADNIPSAQPEVIKTLGDFVWNQLPISCQEMEARPTTGATSFDDDIVLHRWHR